MLPGCIPPHDLAHLVTSPLDCLKSPYGSSTNCMEQGAEESAAVSSL